MIPLQITIHLSEAMVLKEEAARLMTFDGLLAAAAYQRTGDIRAGESLPLKRLTHANGQWVYHASSWRAVGTLHVEPMTIYKRTSQIALETYHLEKSWDRGRGPTKDYHLIYYTYSTPAIRFYCVGDRPQIEALLDYLFYVGSKRSLGKGRIREITIQPMDDDRSLVHNGIVTRPIPIALADTWEGHLQHVGYFPPYWHPDNKTLCRVPHEGPLVDTEDMHYAYAT